MASARETYPTIWANCRPGPDASGAALDEEMRAALDEIDRLRWRTTPSASALPPPPPPFELALTRVDLDGLGEARRLGAKLAEANKPSSELDAFLHGESDEYRAALLGAYRASFPERRRAGNDVWQVRSRTPDTVETVKVSSNGVVSEYRCAWPIEDWDTLSVVTP